MGLKAIREDEDKAQSLGVPTFSYKLVAFVVSAFFTALAGGLYALWFGFLDPIFQFSILVGAYMVLMSLLGGIRSLFGPLLGAVIVGYAVEYFKNQYGDTQFHLVAMGLLLGVVVLFMPDGIIPALGQLVEPVPAAGASIREVSAGRPRRAAPSPRHEPVDPGGRPGDRRRPTTAAAPRDRRSPAVTTTERTPETTAAPSEVNLATEGLTQVLRRRPRRRRRDRALPPRQGQRADRAQRLRQDDLLQLRHRHDQARRGHRHLPGRDHHRQGPAPDRPGRHRPQLPAVPRSSRG